MAPATPPPATDDPRLEACAIPAQSDVVLWFGELDVAPGETVPLRPVATARPGAVVAIPPGCATGWVATPPGSVSLEGTPSLRIAADAAPASTGTVTASIAGRKVSAVFRVMEPVLAPLLGTWRQDGGDCRDGRPPIGELRLTGDRRFQLTFVPFETYVDAWGNFEFDPAAKRLMLAVTGGNRDIGGRALTLERVELGSGRLAFDWPQNDVPDPTQAGHCRRSFRQGVGG